MKLVNAVSGMSPKKEHLNFPLAFLKILGYHPIVNDWQGKIVAALYLPLLVTMSVLVTINLFKIDIKVIKDLAQSFEAFMTFCQMSIKVLTMQIYRNKIGGLLIKRKQFWNINCCGKDIEDKMRAMLDRVLRWLKVFSFCAGSTIVLMTIKALISDQNDLPMACWVPEGYPHLYAIIFVSEIILVSLVLAFVIGFDGVFALLCTELVVQFKLLNAKISSVKTRSDDGHYEEKKFQVFVKHHDFLLRFCNEVQEIYSIFFLGQYFITTASACMELYIISESVHNYELIIKSIFYVSSLLTQLISYCWPATNLTQETLKVSKAIYGTEWFLYGTSNIKTYIQLIIQRSQKVVLFTAAGMQTVDWEGFSFVFKTSFSFFTLMRSMKK